MRIATSTLHWQVLQENFPDKDDKNASLPRIFIQIQKVAQTQDKQRGLALKSKIR